MRRTVRNRLPKQPPATSRVGTASSYAWYPRDLQSLSQYTVGWAQRRPAHVHHSTSAHHYAGPNKKNEKCHTIFWGAAQTSAWHSSCNSQGTALMWPAGLRSLYYTSHNSLCVHDYWRTGNWYCSHPIARTLPNFRSHVPPVETARPSSPKMCSTTSGLRRGFAPGVALLACKPRDTAGRRPCHTPTHPMAWQRPT